MLTATKYARMHNVTLSYNSPSYFHFIHHIRAHPGQNKQNNIPIWYIKLSPDNIYNILCAKKINGWVNQCWYYQVRFWRSCPDYSLCHDTREQLNQTINSSNYHRPAEPQPPPPMWKKRMQLSASTNWTNGHHSPKIIPNTNFDHNEKIE